MDADINQIIKSGETEIAKIRDAQERIVAENKAMRDAIKEAQSIIEDWQLFWRDNGGTLSSKAWADGFALGGPTTLALAKLKPFLK